MVWFKCVSGKRIASVPWFRCLWLLFKIGYFTTSMNCGTTNCIRLTFEIKGIFIHLFFRINKLNFSPNLIQPQSPLLSTLLICKLLKINVHLFWLYFKTYLRSRLVPWSLMVSLSLFSKLIYQIIWFYDFFISCWCHTHHVTVLTITLNHART